MYERSTIETFGLVHNVEATSTIPVNIHTQYSCLFIGLGYMSEPCKMRIKCDATPYAITLPRLMPLSLMLQVKDELETPTTSQRYRDSKYPH